jgi:hypothetical protein
MAKKYYLITIVLGLSLTSTAHADIYSCKDSAGRLITSDRPIPECADKTEQIFNNNGTLKDQLAAPPTPEQRHATELREQQRVKEAQQQEEIKREQRYLTAHYPNENAIETARKQAIEAIEAKIIRENHAIEMTTKTLNQQQEVLDAIPQNQPVKIRAAQLKVDDLTQSINEANHLIASYRQEEVNVNRQFDETHRRYLEIIPANRK